jgi:hypothetical protein
MTDAPALKGSAKIGGTNSQSGSRATPIPFRLQAARLTDIDYRAHTNVVSARSSAATRRIKAGVSSKPPSANGSACTEHVTSIKRHRGRSWLSAPACCSANSTIRSTWSSRGLVAPTSAHRLQNECFALVAPARRLTGSPMSRLSVGGPRTVVMSVSARVSLITRKQAPYSCLPLSLRSSFTPSTLHRLSSGEERGRSQRAALKSPSLSAVRHCGFQSR